MVELLDDMLFGFLDAGEESPESSFGSGGDYDGLDGEDHEAVEGSFNGEESKAFWDDQFRNLQVIKLDDSNFNFFFTFFKRVVCSILNFFFFSVFQQI